MAFRNNSSAAPKIERKTLPEEKTLPREAVRQQAETEKHHIPLHLAVSVLLCCAMVLLSVVSYVQLFEITSEVADVKSELSEAQRTNAVLLSTYESKIDRDKVEKIATEDLGMTTPSAGQTVELDLCGPDRAEVLSGGSQNAGGLLRALRDSVTGFTGFFSRFYQKYLARS